MSGSLIERIRAARQTRVEHDGKLFTVSRPTDWEVYEMSINGKNQQLDVLEKFVCGWENFTEQDLVPGGNATAVLFDKTIFREWVADHPEFWTPITTGITTEYLAHKERQLLVEKK